MGRRIELRAELICLQIVFGRLESVLRVGIDLALGGKSFDIGAGPGWCEGRVGEARPDGNMWRDRMSQVDIFRAF